MFCISSFCFEYKKLYYIFRVLISNIYSRIKFRNPPCPPPHQLFSLSSMTQIQVNSAKSEPCFTGCFRFSRKKATQDMDQTVKTGSVKKKTRWISWTKFLVKKYAVKTVPVESSVSEKLNRSPELQSPKSLHRVSSKKHKQDTGVNLVNNPATGPDRTVNNKAHKKRPEIEEDIILENRELDHSAVKDDTRQKPSGWKRDDQRTGSSNPGSPPVTKKVSKKTSTSPPHSESPPAAPKRKKHKAVSGGDDNVIRETDGRFDPIVGMSIVMVTLVIMLLWGKLCAILCTSAWFFLVPRLRKAMDSNVVVENGSNSGEPDLNSEEYKKKVVLEGLLQRNRRSGIGIW